MLLEIDNEIGNLDDLDILASNDQIEKVNNIINFKIDSFTCIGNNNEIKDSLIAGTDVKKDGK